MSPNVYLMLLLAGILLAVIVVSSIISTLSSTLVDMAEGESWNEIIGCAVVAVIAALVLSIFEFSLVKDPIRVSVNVTGVIIPMAISVFILVKERFHAKEMLALIALVAVLGFLLTRIDGSSVVIDFPLYIIPAVVAAMASFFIVQRDTDSDETSGYVRMASMAYCAGSLGMLFGGDLLHLPQIMETSPSSVVLGAGGLTDFVFLTGVLAIATAWGGHTLISFLKRLAERTGWKETPS